MFKQRSLHRESKRKLVQAFLQATKPSHTMARLTAGERGLDGNPSYQTLANASRAQVSELLMDEVPLPRSHDGLLGLQSLFSNQALQSMLGGGVTRAERVEKTCACGGSCSKCSQEKDSVLGKHLAQQLLERATVQRKPLEDEADEEEPVVKPMPVHSDCGSSCGLHDWMEPDRTRETDEQVHQGAATVVCNGSGDYRVDLGGWATATCGVVDCVRKHEESHIADLRVRYANGCKNADGSSKPDGTPHPTGGADYADWRNKTECTANTVEIPCYEALLKNSSPECQPVVEGVLKQTEQDKKKYCSGGC